MNIFLVGMMGCGKTYTSKLLAQKLHYNVYDLDEIIAEKEKLSITNIFETFGETYFRRKETETLQGLKELKNIVVATGGGTPCFHNNMNWMNEHGITVWLNEPLPVLMDRLKNEKQHRPLIKNLSNEELGLFLEKKLIERATFYKQSQYILSSEECLKYDFKFQITGG